MSKGTKISFLIILAAILLGPIAVYIWKFGFHITADHARWAELGSALGGIYAPILSILTIGVLVNQVHLQRQMTVHHLDQSLIQESRSDIDFILSRLDELFAREKASGTPLKKVITAEFRRVSAIDKEVGDKADKLNEEVPQLFELWSAVYPVLEGLKHIKRYPYVHNYMSALQKITYVLSFRTCAALDNYHRAVCREKLDYDYQFSAETSGSFGSNQ